MNAAPVLAALAASGLLFPAAVEEERAALDPALVAAARTHSPLPERPEDPTNRFLHDPRAARLGQALFHDRRLSADGAVSCATCHDAARGLGDGQATPEGFDVRRNAPTLWNVAYQRWFFWDGRADSLWAQALEPLENPREHDSTRLEVAHVVARDPDLREAYESVFGDLPPLHDPGRFPARAAPRPLEPADPADRAWRGMAAEDRAAVDRVFAGVGKSLAAHVARLTARDAPFDRFVAALERGDPGAADHLGPAALRGFALFAGDGGCRACHAGPLFSDREFHDLRLPPLDGRADPGRAAALARLEANPFGGAGAHSDAPAAGAARLEGLRGIGARPELWGQFRTPTLRNVARTAPYMHDGRFATLREVLQYYSTMRGAVPADAHGHGEVLLRPRGFTPEEIDDLVAFLESLTDERLDPALLAPPAEAAR